MSAGRGNILASGIRRRAAWAARRHLLPAFTLETARGLAWWEVVSSHSSATASDLHGVPSVGSRTWVNLAKNCSCDRDPAPLEQADFGKARAGPSGIPPCLRL